MKKLAATRPDLRRLAFGRLAVTLALAAVGWASGPPQVPVPSPSRPAEDFIGERLFLDTRFAEYFAAHMVDINEPLSAGDPAVETTATVRGSLAGPFAGESMNCRSCHFVAEFLGETGGGNRTYSDFSRRSALPRTLNGFSTTPRNAMPMVGSLRTHGSSALLHFDGEFATAEELVASTLVGRNFGWAPQQQAVAHISRVIREDDGSSEVAKEGTELFSYRQLFLGADPLLPPYLRIPRADRLDVTKASDAQILRLVSKCIAVYMAGLQFQQDAAGRYVGSPYDAFLRLNHLPERAREKESAAQYVRRLRVAVEGLRNPVWVDESKRQFRYHAQPFRFSSEELKGLLIFLRASSGNERQHAGNCAACHRPPQFTDFSFHNTGVSQEEFDAGHGEGAFLRLPIPGLQERNRNYDRFLPQTARHPAATEHFRRAADSASDAADLGLWNVYLNPDMPSPQARLRGLLCRAGNCESDPVLASTIARFKTPTLRDLEDSDPYFHNGSQETLEGAVEFYLRSSRRAQRGKLRNAPPEFQAISLTDEDVRPLAAFLRSLTENYDEK